MYGHLWGAIPHHILLLSLSSSCLLYPYSYLSLLVPFLLSCDIPLCRAVFPLYPRLGRSCPLLHESTPKKNFQKNLGVRDYMCSWARPYERHPVCHPYSSSGPGMSDSNLQDRGTASLDRNGNPGSGQGFPSCKHGD